ncbi:MAG: hypothetical protein KBC60_05815, partial [Haliscomenobacter sp.]|nr:hypothetical protein [Haliscomenobacter sp.]
VGAPFFWFFFWASKKRTYPEAGGKKERGTTPIHGLGKNTTRLALEEQGEEKRRGAVCLAPLCF